MPPGCASAWPGLSCFRDRRNTTPRGKCGTPATITDPALIAQPLSVADVQAAVLFAADQGLPVSVRGGGHNHAGYAVADGALMLDLSAMTSVRVDPARRVATVSGGATWGVVDQATQAADLAVTRADVSPVGVGGATLGGGVAAGCTACTG